MTKLVAKYSTKNLRKVSFDESPRTLPEILELINQYPWLQQRPLTDVQPTGPSVTVEREDGEHLKVGLGFNQKYCLYLLNDHHQLFEHYIATLEEVADWVTKFCNGANLEPLLEKHILNIGVTGHFVTKPFEYTFKNRWMLVRYGVMCLLSLIYVPITFLPITGRFWPA